MTKIYPASDNKLLKLKEDGEFVRSSFLSRSIKLFLFSLFLYALTIIDYQPYFDFYADSLSVKYNNFLPILKLPFLFLLMVFLVFSIYILINKFYFSLGLASIRTARFRMSRGIFSLNSLFHLSCLFLLLVISYKLLIGFYEVHLYNLLQKPALDIVSRDFFHICSVFMLKLSCLFLVFGALSYLINWISFRFKHMMTKEEYEAEVREQESAYSRS